VEMLTTFGTDTLATIVDWGIGIVLCNTVNNLSVSNVLGFLLVPQKLLFRGRSRLDRGEGVMDSVRLCQECYVGNRNMKLCVRKLDCIVGIASFIYRMPSTKRVRLASTIIS
jgi:hypothetical protein